MLWPSLILLNSAPTMQQAALGGSATAIRSIHAPANTLRHNIQLPPRHRFRTCVAAVAPSKSDTEELFRISTDHGRIHWGDYAIEDTNDMRFYLDSASLEEWRKWIPTGLFYGFTTNPTILKRDGVRCDIDSLGRLVQAADNMRVAELQLQAWGDTADEIFSSADLLLTLDRYTRKDRPLLVIKVPMTLEGIKAAARLIEDGVRVTMTAVHAPHQVVTSLAIGATYAAPYIGRITDAGKDGVAEVLKMQAVVDRATPPWKYTSNATSLSNKFGQDDRLDMPRMRLLAASIRSADEIGSLAAGGCNTFTISPAVASQLFDEKLTIDAAAVFQQHAREMGAPEASLYTQDDDL